MLRKEAGEHDPRAKVYDLLGKLTEPSVPHATHLFVLGGRIGGVANGYFFEHQSSDYLHGLGQVIVQDAGGQEVGRFYNREQAFRSIYFGESPDWIEPGKNYKAIYPEVPENDLNTLWDIRGGIYTRLKDEGRKAAEEFLTVGLAMGGEDISQEEVEQLGDRISGLFDQKRRKEK